MQLIELRCMAPTATPPVVLLHSGGMSSRQWSRLAAALGPGRRVVTPDFLGHGEAPPPPAEGPFDFGLETSRIVALVEELGTPVDLVGHSYGGRIALGVARRVPALLHALVLYEPVAFGVLREPPDAVGLADLARIAEDPVFVDPDPADLDPWLERFVEFWSGPGAWAAMGEPGRAAFRASAPSLARGATGLVADRTTSAEHAAAVTASTLVLCGERSPLASRRVSALLAEALPDARLHTVTGAGHMGPLTHAAEVNDLVLAHLSPADQAG